MIKSENGQAVLEGDIHALLTDTMFVINAVKSAAIDNFGVDEDMATQMLETSAYMAINDPMIEPEEVGSMTVDASDLEEILRRLNENEEN
jgi:hypothetical protein